MKSKLDYDQGPWIAGKPQFRRGSGPRKVPITVVGGKTVGNILTFDKEDKPNGNAIITALAPDMWRAVVGAEAISDLWAPNDSWTEEQWEEAKALYTMLSQFRDVIRKAEEYAKT